MHHHLGAYVPFLAVLASLCQCLLSLEAQIFLTDAPFMELFMAIIFTLQVFPGVLHECAGSRRKLNTMFLCSHASLLLCPRHTVTAPAPPLAGRSVRAAQECSQGGQHLSGKDIH